jgi:hypothetical protein
MLVNIVPPAVIDKMVEEHCINENLTHADKADEAKIAPCQTEAAVVFAFAETDHCVNVC